MSKAKIREEAVAFLEEIATKANDLAEKLDPKHKRNYERDPILGALDGISSQAKRSLATHRAAKEAQ